jgi:uncharacterized phage protein (TIGR01671 family)
MTREIKFRVWNVSKSFYETDDTQWDGFIDQYGLVFRRETGTSEVHQIKDQKDFVVEQYTGLKDADGKEIYEGDILENWSGNRDVVTFSRGAFMVCAIHECRVKLPRMTLSQTPLSHMKVIGNIHENPELLNRTEQL